MVNANLLNVTYIKSKVLLLFKEFKENLHKFNNNCNSNSNKYFITSKNQNSEINIIKMIILIYHI